MKKQISLFTFLIGFVFIHSLYASPNPARYAMIIDAGSTGSRLHLFEYNNVSDHVSAPSIHDLFSQSIKPGLSTYENNPQAAGASLKKILDAGLAEAQKNHIDPSTITLSLFGTAGMRLLSSEKQEAIYNNVALYIKNNYVFIPGEIKTIPGKVEGLFGWLDVNYLLKSFDSPTDITQGSIDVGGASTQIAFSTLDSKPEDSFQLHIGEQVYTIFSKSFSGLGLDEALHQINTQPLAMSCYPALYPLGDNKGNFHFDNCNYLYLDLINQHEVREQLPRHVNKKFVAYSGAYYTENFFGVTQAPSHANLETKVQEVCSKTWEQLVAAYPKEPEKYLSTYCANGVYINQLLYGTYQLQEKQLMVTNKINQQDLDWTLGALLYQLVRSN